MTSDELEFAISQYVDGTLSPDERAALEPILATDREAQKLLAEYRSLANCLNENLPPLPDVNWTAFREHISDQIEFDATERTPYQLHKIRWVARIAIAACILITFGVGLTFFANQIEHRGTVEIAGPQIEQSQGTAIAEVEIGPSQALTQSGQLWQYADNVVNRPGKVTIGFAPSDKQQPQGY